MFDNFLNMAKKVVKNIVRSILFKLIIIVVLITMIIGAFNYIIDIDIGTNKKVDLSNVPGQVSLNTGRVSVSLENGYLKLQKSAQELWDELIKNNSPVGKFLKGPEDLAKLMLTEIITQYPDTRTNKNEQINWEQMTKPESKEAHGIIKLKRTLLDEKENISEEELNKLEEEYEEYKENFNKEETVLTYNEWMESKGYTVSGANWQKAKTIGMTYVNPEVFQKKMDAYRTTGSEESKREAMQYFTLEKSNVLSKYKSVDTINSFDKTLFIGDSLTVGLEKNTMKLNSENKNKLANSIFKAKEGITARYWIENFKELPNKEDVNAVIVLLGVNNPNDSAATKILINKLNQEYPDKYIYVQKVFPVGEKYNNADNLNESIEFYNSEVSEFCEEKKNVYFIDTTKGYINEKGYLSEEKTGDGLHFSDANEWIENLEKNIINQEVNTEVKNNIPKEENKQNNKDAKANKNNANVKLTDDLPNFNNEDAYINKNPYYNPYVGQCTWFAWGLFYDIYGYSPGFLGDGGVCADQLLENHPDKFELASHPIPGAVFSSRNTGSDCGHVGIVLDVDGDNITIAEGNWVPEWNYPPNIKMGTTTTNGWRKATVTSAKLASRDTIYANPKPGYEPTNTRSSKYSTAPYYIKVATWSTISSELTGDTENGKITADPTIVQMRETRINYYDMVRGYIMPFDYLWALLTISQDRDFVMELANLVYNSEIEITVNDSRTTNTTIKTYEFDKMMHRIIENTNLDGTMQNEEETKELSGNPRTVKLTTTSISNTVEAGVTKANTWIVDYSKGYKFVKENTSASEEKKDRNDLNDNPNDIPYVTNTYVRDGDSKIASTVVKKKTYKTNWKEFKATNLQVNKYVEGTPYLREKTSKKLKSGINKDFKYKEKNFVTLLLSSKKAFSNIFSAPSWLYKILESNDSTKEIMVDLTKYLLYKAKEDNSGEIVEFDFSIFEPGKFITIGGFDGLTGNTPQEQVWNALISAGFNEISVAAVMGNIEAESNFVFDSIEAGNGIGYGIVQWSSGRRTKLEEFANLRGKNKSDPALQIEFLIAELTPGGGADGMADYQLGGASSSAYDGNSYVADDWINPTDIDSATTAFMALFERPSEIPEINHLSRRKEAARKYYATFKK